MVSQAFDKGLIDRIKRYVATDLNSKIPPPPLAEQIVDPENVYVLRFTRVLNSWEAVATAHIYPDRFYELVHDGTTGKTVVNVMQKVMTQQAIL